ncbi:MAG: nitrate reductase molybdenum cofactor assembly chaperone [Micromonosporaceae bacterium]
MSPHVRAVAAKAAALLLQYPDDSALAALPTIAAALAELPAELAGSLGRVHDHRVRTDPGALASEYVELFDLRRRCCLYLTYYTAGDTRERGAALVEFARAYAAAGYAIDGGELPDFLPAVLHLAAAAGEPAWVLLRRHRIGLDLLAQALDGCGSVYRHAIDAVRVLLPPASRADLVAAVALARSGPPREEVGLQPFALAPGGRR